MQLIFVGVGVALGATVLWIIRREDESWRDLGEVPMNNERRRSIYKAEDNDAASQ